MEIILYALVILLVSIWSYIFGKWSAHKQEVVEVKEIIRSRVDIVDFKYDFTITEYDKMYHNPEMLTEYQHRNAVISLAQGIPNEMFTKEEHTDFRNNTTYSIKLSVMPPLKMNKP